MVLLLFVTCLLPYLSDFEWIVSIMVLFLFMTILFHHGGMIMVVNGYT
jgi:hypothetical protein